MDINKCFRKLKYFVLPLYQWLVVQKIRRKKNINVVFIAMSVSMWRYQHLYEEMSKNPRFKVTILILPCIVYSKEQQRIDKDSLITYFKGKGIKYTLGIKDDGTHVDIKNELAPDILFYPQPYTGNFHSDFEAYNFYDRLLCYCPYAFWRNIDSWSYDNPYQNRAWKLFYSTELHRMDAERYAFNKGQNVEVVGYPTADDFLVKSHTDVWKPQSVPKKRVIWAPHFTIFTGGDITQSNFLWMADFMIEMAKQYSEQIQFVFKPHPRLFTELCKHQGWGEERAKQYYHQWETMENTQLMTGEFIDLFMTSDAMIHDSGSFCVEYHYSGNPVMYIADNFEEQVAKMGVFGQLAMRKQYVGKNSEDIIRFVEEVILGGNDPMKEERLAFANTYLIPPNGKAVAQNIMDVLLKAFC